MLTKGSKYGNPSKGRHALMLIIVSNLTLETLSQSRLHCVNALGNSSSSFAEFCLFQKQWSTYHSSRLLELKQNFVPPICCSADIALPCFLVHYFEHFWAHFLNKNIVCSVNCKLYISSPPPLTYAGSTSAFWRSLQNLRNGWAPCAASLANGLNKVENEQAYVANTHSKHTQKTRTGSKHRQRTHTANIHSKHTQQARENA